MDSAMCETAHDALGEVSASLARFLEDAGDAERLNAEEELIDQMLECLDPSAIRPVPQDTLIAGADLHSPPVPSALQVLPPMHLAQTASEVQTPHVEGASVENPHTVPKEGPSSDADSRGAQTTDSRGAVAQEKQPAIKTEFEVYVNDNYKTNCAGLQLLHRYTREAPLVARTLEKVVDQHVNPIGLRVTGYNRKDTVPPIPHAPCPNKKRWSQRGQVPYPCNEHSCVTIPCIVAGKPRDVTLVACFNSSTCKRSYWYWRTAPREGGEEQVTSRRSPDHAQEAHAQRHEVHVLLQQQRRAVLLREPRGRV